MHDMMVTKRQAAAMYMFVSECYYPPEDVLLETLHELGEALGGPYLELAQAVPRKDALGEMKLDHARLFVGPYKLLAPPYESTYMENSSGLTSESAREIRKLYREEGLDMAIKDMPDHLIVELEFLHFLMCRQVQAACDSDPEAANRYSDKRRSFVENHLGRWISDFAGEVEKHAKTDFYKTLARLTESLVQGEHTLAHSERRELLGP